MKLNLIFAVTNNRLLAIQNKNEKQDEFSKAFNQWHDIAYLENFFENNNADLQRGFFGQLTIKEAVFKTVDESNKFEKYIRKKIAESKKTNEPILNDLIFKPLNKHGESINLQKSKAYGTKNKSWLRLYAIRISINVFVVCGSAIKLTKSMNEKKHLMDELKKMEIAVNYLKEVGLCDENDCGYIEIILNDNENR